jgi:hypothetical protein
MRTRWVRFCVYAIVWLPPLGIMTWFIPQWGPLFQKLEEKGELPQFTAWTWGFVKLNQECFYLPTLLGLAMLIAFSELIIANARRLWVGRLSWVTALVSTSMVAWFLIFKTLTINISSRP